jgi:hypothetical protein
MRQAARILEREGLLRVKRGLGGGYFGIRPSYGSVQAAVSDYLEALNVPQKDVTAVASVLWVEAVRQAASVRNDVSTNLASRFSKKVATIGDDATFEAISAVELAIRSIIFDMIDAPYVELIFSINSAFATRHPPHPSAIDHCEEHREFVRAWRDARMLELNAISIGEPEVAAAAARHLRKVWDERLAATSRLLAA